MKKRGLAVLLVLVILFAIFYIPYPRYINRTMKGPEVLPDGTVLGNVSFTVEGWLLNYLIREDSMRVKIAFVPDTASPFLYTETCGVLQQISPDYYLSACSAYDSVQNFVSFGCFGLSRDFSASVLQMDGRSYVGSVHDQPDPQELIRLFPELHRGEP